MKRLRRYYRSEGSLPASTKPRSRRACLAEMDGELSRAPVHLAVQSQSVVFLVRYNSTCHAAQGITATVVLEHMYTGQYFNRILQNRDIRPSDGMECGTIGVMVNVYQVF